MLTRAITPVMLCSYVHLAQGFRFINSWRRLNEAKELRVDAMRQG